MRLILRIFRKDVRRLAAPIVALLAIEAVAAYSEIQKYLSSRALLPRAISVPNSTVLPFAWIFLIAALVLQERLPGTRQYWLTRPIDWPKLLAAKLLFVAVFVNAAWFLSDSVILLVLHLPVHPADLLLRQIPLTSLLFLPAFCLSSISTGLGQIALGLIVAVFGFILEVLVPAILSSHPSRATFVGFDNRLFSSWPEFALPAMTVLLIVFQFARRATLPARLLFLIPLLFIPFTFFAIASGFPPESRIEEDKPDDGLAAMKISFDLNSGRHPESPLSETFTGLQFPIHIEGLPPTAYIEGRGSGEWPGLGNYFAGASLYHDQTGQWLRFSLRDELLTKLPPDPTRLKASLQISTFKIEKTQTVPLRTGTRFSPVPGVYCRASFSADNPFFCWSGPQQQRSVQYRAFMLFDYMDVQLNAGSSSVFEHGLLWTFSPVVSWTLALDPSKPRSSFSADTQARFLTLAPTGTLKRTLRAEKVDLAEYLVKP